MAKDISDIGLEVSFPFWSASCRLTRSFTDMFISEALYEDEAFPNRELAALVAAKAYYQLQEYDESMVFALGAGKLFNLDHPGEFEETIVGRCEGEQQGTPNH